MQAKGSDCVAWSCDKLSQLHAMQTEPLAYQKWCIKDSSLTAHKQVQSQKDESKAQLQINQVKHGLRNQSGKQLIIGETQ